MVRTKKQFRFWLAGSLILGGMAAAVHCGNQEPDSTFVDGGGGPCETTFKDRCGAPCESDIGCGDGLHCAAGKCTAVCTSTNRGNCPVGISCSPRGRCGEDPSDSGVVGDGNVGDATNDNVCASIDVEVTKVVPTVVLLIDQSSSMESTFGGTQTAPPNFPNSRWVNLRDSLMDPDGGIVKKYEGDVEFGLALYSANSGDEKPPAVATCPIMKLVPFAKSNHAAINAAYAPEVPIDDTPTGEAVKAAAGLDDLGNPVDGGFASLPTGRPKVIVLATDGEPATCANLDVTGTAGAQKLVVDNVQAAYRAGIKTYVITVGTNVSEAHQQAVANAGHGYFDGGVADAGPDANAPLIRTTSQAQLAAAFDEIIFGVRSCSFKLNGQVVPGTAGQGDVRVNGTPLTLNDPNGWKLTSPNEIEITGTSCNIIKTSDAKVTVRFPCSGFIPR